MITFEQPLLDKLSAVLLEPERASCREPLVGIRDYGQEQKTFSDNDGLE